MRESDPARPPGGAGAAGYPPPSYAPVPPAPTPPPPAPAPSPAPTAAEGPAPAAGLPCTADSDFICPFGRCLGGRCGGCRRETDCKPGAACASTPVGMTCVPSAAPAPPPTATASPSAPPRAVGPAPDAATGHRQLRGRSRALPQAHQRVPRDQEPAGAQPARRVFELRRRPSPVRRHQQEAPRLVRQVHRARAERVPRLEGVDRSGGRYLPEGDVRRRSGLGPDPRSPQQHHGSELQRGVMRVLRGHGRQRLGGPELPPLNHFFLGAGFSAEADGAGPASAAAWASQNARSASSSRF